jgi:hypothetical protein
MLGRAEMALPIMEAALANNLSDSGVMHSHFSAVLAHAGRHDEAKTIVKQLFAREDATRGDGYALSAPCLALALESSLITGDRDSVVRLRKSLAGLEWMCCAQDHSVSIGRLLGEAAAMLSEPLDARSLYEETLTLCEEMRFRPEIALIHLDLAELLLDHYPDERDAAIEHLDFAIAEFQEMKMQPALERALRHRGLLKA